MKPTRPSPSPLALFPFALVFILVLGVTSLILGDLRLWTPQMNIFRALYTHSRTVPRMFVSEADRIKDECNVFQGRWVWDNVSYPLYREESCPYLVKQVTCLKNGRPDSSYQHWRWQPDGCNLPRFDPYMMLEMLRGKRMMFVGDSLQRAQFDSLVCLLQSAIPPGKRSLNRIPPRKIFSIEDYDISIEYYWAPFIVESISDHATNHTVHKRMVRLDSVDSHSEYWAGVDVLVFESYVWWMHKPVINATYGGPSNMREYNVTTAYRLALDTWATWLEGNIDPQAQKVYFMSMSPTHLWSWEWKAGSDDNCFNESEPIKGRDYWGTGSNKEMMGILGDVLKGLKKINVTLLNITQLSEYRKDGHTSVFTERKGKLLTKEEKAEPRKYADCIHWCLPGVPDAWNEILYAYLLRDYQSKR